MTVAEMNDRFNVLYDNADQEAPGLNLYEKSLYLTMAANSVVDKIIKPITQKGSKSNRDDDANRDKLRGLERYWSQDTNVSKDEIIDGSLKNVSTTVINNSDIDSLFIWLPDNLAHIDYERLQVVTRDEWNSDKISLPIKPTRQSFVERIIRDPFNKPNILQGYRINHTDRSSRPYGEIIMPHDYSFDMYECWYFKYPRAIVLVDFDTEYPGMNLSLDGFTKPYSEDEPLSPPTALSPATDINPDMHDDIIEEAVRIAILHYRENTLQNNVQIDQLNRQEESIK